MVPTLTPTSRSALFDELEGTRFDVVIAGGGITGAAVARDAAARGLRVAVVEADDFAAGTSSRSSKLIHGGLRYLANGELGFIRQTSRERTAVHAMAPHLAEPCWMLVPARNRAMATAFRAGVGLYERLGAVADVDRHQQWRGADIVRHEPHLRTDHYDRVIAYREYLTDDARLVIGVLRAAVATGARVCSRAPVVGVVRVGDRIDGVMVRCPITGREVEVRSNVVVNAAGPWVENLARMEQERPGLRVHLSKGVHIVVEHERFPVHHPVLCTAGDKRWIFVIPRGDVVYIGTTDTSYHGDRAQWPEVATEDVRYLLAPLTRYFDIDELGLSDVIATWSGVRPLIARHGNDPKAMSRQAEVTVGPGGMVSIAGGKLTGFRRVAQDVMSVVAEQLGGSLGDGPGTTPIPGGEAASPVNGHAHTRLHRLYGSEASDVASLGGEPILDGGSVCVGEIDWAIDVEAALTLEDVLYRRTRAAWFLPKERAALAPAVAQHMAERLGWDARRHGDELADVQSRFADELAFKAPAPASPA